METGLPHGLKQILWDSHGEVREMWKGLKQTILWDSHVDGREIRK